MTQPQDQAVLANRQKTDTFVSDMRRIIDHWRLKAPAEVMVILYTNPDIYQNFIAPAIKRIYGLEGEMWLEELEVWLANYTGQGVDGEPTMPKNRTRHGSLAISRTKRPTMGT
jgi:hypothetical protein